MSFESATAPTPTVSKILRLRRAAACTKHETRQVRSSVAPNRNRCQHRDEAHFSARVRDRRPKPELRGMEALLATRDALSRDVLGVAHRLSRLLSRASPLPNDQELFPLRNQRRPARGIVPGAPDRHPWEVISMGGAR